MVRPLMISVLLMLLVALACHAQDWARQRERMVQVVKAQGVSDARVLQAMRKVERHLFVPERYRPFAYADRALPIEHEQTISQPYIVGFMTEALQLQGDETVLEIGAGSGYQAAILAELSKRVYTIEIICALADSARERLRGIGYRNVEVLCGDGYRGWPEHAPFDGIIVTAAPDHVPQPLIDQLKVGGRMIIPVGKNVQELMLIEKTKDGATRKAVLPVMFVPLTGPEVEKHKKGK